MKKMLLFSLSILFVFSSNAQIFHTDYGEEGWLIPMNANQEIDVNEDGKTDFHVNGYVDELGLVPIFAIGCFSNSSSYFNNLGTRELEIFEAGELIQLNSANMYDYIDDDRGGVYDKNNGFADGWTNLKEEYVGFAVFNGQQLLDGWMKIVIHEEAQALIIKELAYTISVNEGFDGGTGIIAGQTNQTTSIQHLDKELAAISISPNPASDFVQLSFDYSGQEELSIVVQNSIGQKMCTQQIATRGNSNLTLATSTWTNGMYFIRFETTKGLHTEKILINR